MKRTRGGGNNNNGGVEGIIVGTGDDKNSQDRRNKAKTTGAVENEGRKFYEDKLQQLADERDRVQSGDHEQLTQQSKEAEQKRDKFLKDALVLKELRLKEVEELYAYDCKAANESYENTVGELKSNLISDINEQIKRLEDLRDGVAEEVRSSQRKLRQKQVDENGAEVGADGKEFVPSGAGDKTLGMELFLSEDDVLNDMKAIQADWKQTAEHFLSKEAIMDQEVSVEDDVLYYNELILENNDYVVCTTEATKEEFHGYIQEITDSDILVKLLDGTQTRILIAHLKSGRCKIIRTEEPGNA